MTAKAELFSRLQYLKSTIDQHFLIDQGIGQTEHNGIAGLLRKGLGIVAFNILEDFIKNKTSEALRHVSDSGIDFALLTTTLQEAATKDALSALAFKAKLLKKNGDDWQTFIQDEAQKIYSTKNPTYELSSLSLVSSGSNVTVEEIGKVVAAFGIQGRWNKLGEVATQINSGILNIEDTYRNAANRRHSAAHDAAFQYSYQWLESIQNDIVSICASFDILLTARCRQISSNQSIEIKNHDIDNALKFRYLEEEQNNTVFRETTRVGGRARKRWDTIESAKTHILPRLLQNNEFLIRLNDQGRLCDWYS